MEVKALLMERIEREREHLKNQQVGSEEYNASTSRLNTLEDKLADLEKFESKMDDERKDRKVSRIVDGVKFGVGSVVVPVATTLLILKWEETGSITTAMRGWITNIIPKRPL